MKKTLFQKQQIRYQHKIFKVLTEQNFIIEKKEKQLIKKRISNGRRYFFMIAKRKEGKKIIERFIKIPQNNTKKLLELFKRQIEVAKYLKKKKIIETRGIVAYNYNPKKGIPYAIMETFPINHSKIGFIEGNRGAEFLGTREAKFVIDQLRRLHSAETKTLPSRLRRVLKKHPGDYKFFQQRFNKYLNKKVKALDGKEKLEPFEKVLERRLKMTNLRQKIKDVLINLDPIINSKENKQDSLVHGDMAPNNLYIFDSGKVELLDLEWVGISKNKAMAMIIDFGNLRARSWKNNKFRELLDRELIKVYRQEGKEKLGRAIVQLSILRSHIRLSRFFENYPWEKQKDATETRRRNITEQDIKKAFSIFKI